MVRPKIASLVLTGVVGIAAPLMGACDREDRADVREGVNEAEEGVEDAVEDAEDAVDEADTDGKDD